MTNLQTRGLQARPPHLHAKAAALLMVALATAALGCGGLADIAAPGNPGSASHSTASINTEGCPQEQRAYPTIEEDSASQAMGFDPQDCPVPYYVVPVDVHSATLSDIPIDGTEPRWDGQLVDWSNDYGDWASSCPATLDYIEFMAKVETTGEDAEFKIPAAGEPIVRSQELGYDTRGNPIAKYRLPEMIYNSVNGKYSIYGGVVTVTCYKKLFQVNVYTFKVIVDVKQSWKYEGLGGVRLNHIPNPPSGDAGSGWAYENYSLGIETGSDVGWTTALQTYVNNGGCSEGWEIWVDNRKVCNKDGTNAI
jgi:hypothetical protein